MNESQHLQKKVSLEDLLHLKRAEQPGAAFWTQFEQEMRAKQLSALVRRDPWWRALPRAFARSSRLHLPLGATAVVALAFITVREIRQPSASPSGVSLSPSSGPALVVAHEESEDLPASAVSRETQPVMSYSTNGASALAASDFVGSAPVAIHETALQVSSSVEPDHSNSSEVSPSARSIAANLAAAEASEPALVQVLTRSRGFENGFVAERTSMIEPLNQVTTPRDTRRARLLASAVPADLHAPETSASRSRERITRNLNDEALYDSITRLGLNGNRVSIKF